MEAPNDVCPTQPSGANVEVYRSAIGMEYPRRSRRSDRQRWDAQRCRFPGAAIHEASHLALLLNQAIDQVRQQLLPTTVLAVEDISFAADVLRHSQELLTDRQAR